MDRHGSEAAVEQRSGDAYSGSIFPQTIVCGRLLSAFGRVVTPFCGCLRLHDVVGGALSEEGRRVRNLPSLASDLHLIHSL